MNLVLIACASSEGSGEPVHLRSLARTFAARSYKQWIKRNLQTESQIPGPSEWLGMRSWNLSWRNARRHKFTWQSSNNNTYMTTNTQNVCHNCTCIINFQIFSNELFPLLPDTILLILMTFFQNDVSVKLNMSHSMTKPTKWHVRPAKTQISLGICPVWSEC